jgi:hypothetical protein
MEFYMKKSLVLSSVLASLLLASHLSAAEQKVVDTAKVELATICTMSNLLSQDQAELQNYIDQNYDQLSLEVKTALEGLVGVSSEQRDAIVTLACG